MNYSRVSYRYAKSLLGLAIEQNLLEPLKADMELLANSIGESKELATVLKSPVIKADKKENIIKALFPSLNKATLLFIEILMRRKREGILGQVAFSFIEQYKVHKNITTVMITSAVPLGADLKARVIALVNPARTEVALVEKIDPALIGGLVVRVGDRQIDASVARKISELKQEFSKNLYIPEF